MPAAGAGLREPEGGSGNSGQLLMQPAAAGAVQGGQEEGSVAGFGGVEAPLVMHACCLFSAAQHGMAVHGLGKASVEAGSGQHWLLSSCTKAG